MIEKAGVLIAFVGFSLIVYALLAIPARYIFEQKHHNITVKFVGGLLVMCAGLCFLGLTV